MCTGRIDLAHLFKSFTNGNDGILIGGCRLNECNYITHGNFHALNMVLLTKKIMGHIGLNPERLRIEFMSSGEGNLFAEVVDDFVGEIKELGPLGKGEGIDEKRLMINLEAITRLIPYFRLVEIERLRGHFDTLEEYKQFYASEEFAKLFDELIADKLAVSQIMLVLREKPLSTGEISEIIGLTPSEVSVYLNSSARQGLIRYEESEKRFALA
jgi:F420-non-reducing hydrogenase iron-sulfur subunit